MTVMSPAIEADDDEEVVAFGPNFHMREDGALSNPTAEKLALIIVDGDVDLNKPISTKAQWVAAGGRATPNSEKYKRKILRMPVFKRRLEDLMTERKGLELDPIWGEATWMINQGWRFAWADGDTVSAMKYAEMRIRVAEKSGKTAIIPQPGTDLAQNGPDAPVGAPVTPPPGSDQAPSLARARLMERAGPPAEKAV